MDRNEKQNSYKNTSHTRGIHKKVKKYRRNHIISSCVSLVLLAALVVQSFGYLRLKEKYESTTEELVQLQEESQKEEQTESGGLSEDEIKETSTEPEEETVSTEAEITEKETEEKTEQKTAAETETSEKTDVTETEDQSADAKVVQTALNSAAAEFSGLEYWLVSSGFSSMVTNSVLKMEDVDLSTVPTLGKIFVLGKMYERLQNAGNGTEQSMRDSDYVYEADETLNTELRTLAAVMMGQVEKIDGFVESSDAAAIELIKRIGEEYGDGDAILENVTNKDEAYTKGLEKINEFCKKAVAGEEINIAGFDFQGEQQPVNLFGLKDCVNFFETLGKTGFDLSEELQRNMKERMKDPEDSYVKKTVELAGDGCEILHIDGIAEDETGYEIYSVKNGEDSYILAVKISAETDSAWKEKMAAAAYDALLKEKEISEQTGETVGTAVTDESAVTEVTEQTDETENAGTTEGQGEAAAESPAVEAVSTEA